jgi:hypothetical protein
VPSELGRKKKFMNNGLLLYIKAKLAPYSHEKYIKVNKESGKMLIRDAIKL